MVISGFWVVHPLVKLLSSVIAHRRDLSSGFPGRFRFFLLSDAGAELVEGVHHQAAEVFVAGEILV